MRYMQDDTELRNSAAPPSEGPPGGGWGGGTYSMATPGTDDDFKYLMREDSAGDTLTPFTSGVYSLKDDNREVSLPRNNGRVANRAIVSSLAI